MFRIDRMNVNLASAWSVQVSSEGGEADPEAEGQPVPDATASAAGIMRDILSEAETKAESKAQQIVGEAREKAAAILTDAREQAAQKREHAQKEGYETGRKEGYDEGHAEGKSEGKSAFESKIKEDDDKLKNVLQEIYDERQRTDSELEDELVGLSLAIIKRIIFQADEQFGGVFESLIKSALRQMSTDRKIVIRVGQEEYKRFFSPGKEVFDLDHGMRVTASVIEDQNLEEFGVIIDAGDETVNAGLDTQLQNIQLAFERAV